MGSTLPAGSAALSVLSLGNQSSYQKSVMAVFRLLHERPSTLEGILHRCRGSCLTLKRFFRPAIPRGASAGVFEALKLWDNDRTQYVGKGISQAVEHVSETTGAARRSKKVDKQDREGWL